jgi:hypothetical protein
VNISGALLDGVVINSVMVQAMPYQTSKFDRGLESDGDEASLIFETERLNQFPESEALKGCETEDQKILLKQWLFFKYERLLREQVFIERAEKKLLAKQ